MGQRLRCIVTVKMKASDDAESLLPSCVARDPIGSHLSIFLFHRPPGDPEGDLLALGIVEMHLESVVERRAENVLRLGRQMIPHGGLQVVIDGVRHDGVASRNGIEAIAAKKLLPHPSCIVAGQRIVGQHPPHKPSSKVMSPHEERRFCWPRAKCGAGPDSAISVARGTRCRESLNKRTGLAAKELAAARQ